MFKMNPSAKEFVPAHILKKRQEEAERLGDLTQQLDKVNLESESKESGDEASSKEKSLECSKRVQDDSLKTSTSDGVNARSGINDKNATSTDNQNQSSRQTQEAQNNVQHSNNNNDLNEDEYRLLEEYNDDDDRFLLNAGENLCEFNGEQFIIPGDDEYEPAIRAGYDFGNNEDNEDEDICNAFEEFLENLPSQ